jgi:hypothetical protein
MSDLSRFKTKEDLRSLTADEFASLRSGDRSGPEAARVWALMINMSPRWWEHQERNLYLREAKRNPRPKKVQSPPPWQVSSAPPTPSPGKPVYWCSVTLSTSVVFTTFAEAMHVAPDGTVTFDGCARVFRRGEYQTCDKTLIYGDGP